MSTVPTRPKNMSIVQGSSGVQSHPRYQILEKIASGSFATVYRGRDLELGREVAIKQIHEQFLENPKQLDRYWQEAQLLASFQHPNIVTIYDIVRERGWLIMELMQGNLAKIAGRKPLDLDSLRSTLAHCLRALRFLHAHGIVHGDIKPSNLMIDRRKRIKIGDFGLARRVSDDEGSLIKGTTKYMAPEVVSDEFGDVGPASDLYSLGFVAYELLCGENFESLFPGLSAFGRDKQIAWMMWHAAPDRRLPEIRRTLEGVPEDLGKVIQKLIAKPQAERYKSADEAMSDLKIDIRVVKGETSEDGSMATAAPDPANQRRRLVLVLFAVSVLMSGLVLFWDALFGSKPPEAPKGIAGIVREVKTAEKLLIVEDESGYPNEVPVPDDARFKLVDEELTVFLKDLKPGDRVQPRKSGGDLRVVDVFRPKQTAGRIVHIDAPNSEFEMAVEEGAKRENVMLRVPQNAKLMLNGLSTSLAGLKLEDRVDVNHIRDPKGQASRTVLKLDALRTVRTVGFVVSADDKKLVFEQRDDRSATRKELPIAAACPVTVNGQSKPAEDAPAYKPSDLKPGDRVVVLHDTQVTGLEVSQGKTLSGLIQEIDPAKGTLKVQTSKGEQFSFRVEADCEVGLADEKVSLADLRRYDSVDVTYDPEEGSPPARTIDAIRPPRGQRVALVIALQNYEDRNLTQLDYPLADARRLKETLLKRYACAPERILLLEDPTKADLEVQVPDWLRKTTNQSQLVVYFAGHAYKADDGQVYLATRDTLFRDLEKTGLKLSWLTGEIDNAVADQRIFLFDASHAGSGIDLKKQPAATEMLKSLKSGEGPLLKSTAIVASCSDGERGLDWKAKGHSVFGWAIADAFTLKADTNFNGLVDPQELVTHLQTVMTQASAELKSTQTPALFAP